MSDEITPDGCRHCGDERHHHGLQSAPSAGLHAWEPPTSAQRLERMRARREAAGKPNYRANDIVEDSMGRRILIVAAGVEAYLTRRLNWKPGDCEPREAAWGFRGCERATTLIERKAVGE